MSDLKRNPNPLPYRTPSHWSSIGCLLLIGAIAVSLCSCGGTSSATSEALGATTHARSAASGEVTVSPISGTEDASASSQISFLGTAGTKVGNVSVVGSSSGKHTGHLAPYSTGTGESFIPSKPFTAGERVTVHATVTTGGHQESVSDSFTIGHQIPISQVEFPINQGDPGAVQHYISAPTLTPSTVKITTQAKPGVTQGDFFLDPYQGSGAPGPMIVDSQGNLIWDHTLGHEEESTNFHVQSYEGKPVLTWWQGRILKLGFGQGQDEIYDTSYRHLATVRAGNGYKADLHEIRLEPDGTAWIDIFDPVKMNLSSVHGAARGVLTDSVIQEIDIRTGLVMWEWHALGHIALAESQIPASRNEYPWDYAHINTVDPGSNHDVLLSSRSAWTLYDVSLQTGAINWRLGGGKRSSFKLGPGVKFYWQHDAEWEPSGEISLFDNGSTPPKEKQSRGLILQPNYTAHTVKLVKAFTNPTQTLLASSQGNMLNLAEGATSGNWLMGYGGLPNFTEYNAKGEVLLDATLGKNVQDFRTYLSPWNATPTTSPSIAAQGSGSDVTVEASWNGATNVSSWQVLAGPSGSLTPTGTATAKTGFQTTIKVQTSGPDVAVRALTAAGEVLGTSSSIPAS
jgi:Arylsulfotransferase (ASST)